MEGFVKCTVAVFWFRGIIILRVRGMEKSGSKAAGKRAKGERKMEHYIITIGREFGSRGREIGEKLGAALGIPVYDKEVIEIGAKKRGIRKTAYSYLDKLIDEKLNGYNTDRIRFESSYVNQMFELQAETIRELAKEKSCIFIGRCADYVLENYKNCINIFIFASYSERYYHLLDEYGLTEEETKTMIARVDRARHEYYKHFTGRNRGDRQGRQLVIDSGLFGVEGTVAMLEGAIKARFGDTIS